MSLITNKGKAIKQDLGINEESQRGELIAKAFIKHLDNFHSMEEKFDKTLELEILNDAINNINSPKELHFKKGLPVFSPSSASKCERELFYKAKKEDKDEEIFLPYQRRWVRNGSAVHAAVQKDLLYAEKFLNNPQFTVVKMKAPESVKGRPAWEHNLKNVKHYPERGFQIFGMMDGILEYVPEGIKLGFEFKTKSTTISAIGSYKMKAPQDDHLQQVTAYSLLFGIEEFLLVYESVAKDSWNKGEEAKPDIRVFHVKVTNEQKQELLEKFERVAKAIKNNKIPQPELDKCLFCRYKEICEVERDGE